MCPQAHAQAPATPPTTEPASAHAAASAVAAAPAPTPGSAVVVQLVGGDVLRGELVSESADFIVLKHPILGEITLARANIASVAVPPPPQGTESKGAQAPAEVAVVAADVSLGNAASSAPAGEAAAKADAVAGQKAGDAPKEEKPPPSKWKFTVAANLNYVDANVEQLDFRVAGSVVYDDPDVEKFKLDVEYFFRNVDESQTDNNLLVTGVYDYFIKESRWLLFGKVQGQMDQLQNWEQRLSGWGGAGYRFYIAPPVGLTGKVGAGATREFGSIQQTNAELYAQLEGKWIISEVQTLEASAWIAPSFDDFSQYLVLARAEWSMKIDPTIGLSLLGGVRWQFQSQVPSGQNPDDTRIYAGLKLDF